MSSIDTRKKIATSAIKLFNQYGVANVRLQMIADESKISIGNLAYHFKNKEAIIQLTITQLQKSFLEILSAFGQHNNFLDFDVQLDNIYHFIKNNPFFFFDAYDIKRNYPRITLFKSNCPKKMLAHIDNRFRSSVEAGILKKEATKGYYSILAQSIWNYIVFFIPQSLMLKKETPTLFEFKEHIWMQLIPHLTEKGNQEFAILLSPSTLH